MSFQEIRDGVLVNPGQELKPTSYVPQLSTERGIALAKQLLQNSAYNWDLDQSNLPVRTTVALFTGRPEDGTSVVKDLKVRVVVFDNVPYPLRRTNPGEVRIARMSMLFDDATGEFVMGTYTDGPPSLKNGE